MELRARRLKGVATKLACSDQRKRRKKWGSNRHERKTRRRGGCRGKEEFLGMREDGKGDAGEEGGRGVVTVSIFQQRTCVCSLNASSESLFTGCLCLSVCVWSRDQHAQLVSKPVSFLSSKAFAFLRTRKGKLELPRFKCIGCSGTKEEKAAFRHHSVKSVVFPHERKKFDGESNVNIELDDGQLCIFFKTTFQEIKGKK